MSWDPSRTHTREQRRRAAWVIARAGGLCQIQGEHCIRTATEDDHIVPRSQGGSDADLTNHQAACKPCHAAKTKAEAALARVALNARLRRPKQKHPGLK